MCGPVKRWVQVAAGVDAGATPCDEPVDAGAGLEDSVEPVLVAVSVLVVEVSDEAGEAAPVPAPVDDLESFL